MARLRQSLCLVHEEAIHSFINCLQSLRLERGTILGSGEVAMNKTDVISLFMEFTLWGVNDK